MYNGLAASRRDMDSNQTAADNSHSHRHSKVSGQEFLSSVKRSRIQFVEPESHASMRKCSRTWTLRLWTWTSIIDGALEQWPSLRGLNHWKNQYRARRCCDASIRLPGGTMLLPGHCRPYYIDRLEWKLSVTKHIITSSRSVSNGETSSKRLWWVRSDHARRAS